MNYQYQYLLLVESLKQLASSYEIQKKSLPKFVDIIDEVAGDFEEAFLLCPQLIEHDFLSKKAIASIIRCYNHMELLLNNDEYNNIESFKNHERWNKVRYFAKEALLNMNIYID